MKFRFKVIFILILSFSLLIFGSCSQNEEDIPEEPEADQEEDASENSNQDQVEEDNQEPDSNKEEENETSNGDEPVSSETEEPDEEELKIDSGTYVGLIDSNHIEIKISGVPEEIASKVFVVDEEIKNTIEEEITEEDDVKFEYYLNEDDVGVIIAIEKILN